MAIFSDIVIRRNSIVRKTRVLPSPGEVLVEVGDVVGPSAIVAKTDYLRDSPRVLDLNMELQRTVTPDMVDAAIVKRPGDSVRRGEVLALFPGDTTGETIEICSPCNGVVQYVSRLRAKIIILEDPDSMAPMTVVDVSSILNINPREMCIRDRVRPDLVARWLPKPIDEAELLVRNWLLNKTLRPSTLPQTADELMLEQSFAREAIRLSLNDHKQVAKGLRGIKIQRQIGDVFTQSGTADTLLNLMDVSRVIGLGGVLAKAPRPAQAMSVLLDLSLIHI